MISHGIFAALMHVVLHVIKFAAPTCWHLVMRWIAPNSIGRGPPRLVLDVCDIHHTRLTPNTDICRPFLIGVFAAAN